METIGKTITGTPLSMQKKALEIFAKLDASKKEEKLLHGDLHYDNILFDEKRGWLSIDPKGVIADPAYAAARLLNNRLPLKDAEAALRMTKKRVEILSCTLQESSERIMQWAYFDAVLCVCWSLEEGNEENAQNGFACAEIFDSLLR